MTNHVDCRPEEHVERDNLATRAARIWPGQWAATYEIPHRQGRHQRWRLREKLLRIEAWGVTPVRVRE